MRKGIMISVIMNGKPVKVHVEFFPSKEKKVVKLEDRRTGIELLKNLDLHLDSYILVRDDMPIPIDQKLNDGDKIKILSVVSGG